MASTDDDLRRDGGRWEIPLGGGLVTQVRIDFAFGLLVDATDEHENTGEIRISTQLAYEAAGAVTMIDPERTPELAPLITLHQAVLVSACTSDDGELELRFAGDRTICVAPDPGFEAWGLTVSSRAGRRGMHLVCLPGSGLARF